MHVPQLCGHLLSSSPGLVELLLCCRTRAFLSSSGVPFGSHLLETLIRDVVRQVSDRLVLDRSEAGEEPLLAVQGGLGLSLDEAAGRQEEDEIDGQGIFLRDSHLIE